MMDYFVLGGEVFVCILNLDNLEIRKGKDLAKRWKLVFDLTKKRKSIVSEGAIARGFSLKLPELVWTSCDLAEASVGSLKDCIFLVDVLTKRKSLNLWL